ncbi:hypothetical protein ACSMXN_22015 [Jatrophihabitans sp. DSM 45814]
MADRGGAAPTERVPPDTGDSAHPYGAVSKIAGLVRGLDRLLLDPPQQEEYR